MEAVREGPRELPAVFDGRGILVPRPVVVVVVALAGVGVRVAERTGVVVVVGVADPPLLPRPRFREPRLPFTPREADGNKGGRGLRRRKRIKEEEEDKGEERG